MDREKVKQGLHQHCECSLFDRCGECPYYEVADEQFSCRDRLLDNALELLKEQEHKDRMFHALEDDLKQLKKLLNEQNDEIKELRSMVEFWKEKALHT